MSTIKRTQLVIQTIEGQLVTSTSLTFDDVQNEYLTVESLAWLTDQEVEDIVLFCEQQGLIMRRLHGQRWLNCSNLMPLFGWTPD